MMWIFLGGLIIAGVLHIAAAVIAHRPKEVPKESINLAPKIEPKAAIKQEAIPITQEVVNSAGAETSGGDMVLQMAALLSITPQRVFG